MEDIKAVKILNKVPVLIQILLKKYLYFVGKFCFYIITEFSQTKNNYNQ